MLKLRYIIRLITLFVSRFKGLIALSAIFGIVLFFVINNLLPMLANSNTQKIGLAGRYTVSTLPSEILGLISQGLTIENEDGSLSSGIAQSWEVTDEGKTWTFILRQDLTWQDGKKLTSKDINYEFSDVQVERPDNTKIVFRLQEPYSAFGNVVSRPAFKKGLLGMGEWKVDRINTSSSFVQSLTLTNNEKKRIIYKFYPTEERAKIAFKLGEIDTIEDIYDPEPFNSWSGPSIEKNIDTNQHVVLFFNTQDRFLSEKNIRQSLAYGLDKDSLGENRSYSPISITSWAYNSQVKKYEYDKEKASKTISDLPSEVTQGMEIKITVLSPNLLPVAEKIANEWKSMNVSTVVSVASTTPSEYQVLLAVVNIQRDPDQYSLWHSTQMGSNISKFANPRVDKLLEDGRTITNEEERKKIYLDFQRFLVEESPAIFLYYPNTYRISRN